MPPASPRALARPRPSWLDGEENTFSRRRCATCRYAQPSRRWFGFGGDGQTALHGVGTCKTERSERAAVADRELLRQWTEHIAASAPCRTGPRMRCIGSFTRAPAPHERGQALGDGLRRDSVQTPECQGVRADPVSSRRARTADDAGAFKSGSPGRAGTAYAGGRQPGGLPTPSTRRRRAVRGEWPGETRSVQGGSTLSQSPRGAVGDKKDGRGAAVAARHARRCGKEDSRRWAGVLERRWAASAPDY